MFGPTYKAAQTGRDPIDGTPLFWHASDGFPVRAPHGPFAVTKEAAAAARQDLYFRSRVFKIPDQIEEYTAVMDWLCNIHGTVYNERCREDPNEANVWHVWLSWCEARTAYGQQGTTPAAQPR